MRHPFAALALGLVLVLSVQAVRMLVRPPDWASPVTLEVEIRVPEPTELAVYWNPGSGFGERHSRGIEIPAASGFQTVRFPLRVSRWEALRLDGPPFPGEFAVRSLRLVANTSEREWRGRALPEVLAPDNDLEAPAPPDEEDGWVFESRNYDPWFIVRADPPPFDGWSAGEILRLAGFLALALLAPLVFLAMGRVLLRAVLESMPARGSPERRSFRWLGAPLLLAPVALFQMGLQVEHRPVAQARAGHNLYLHLTEAWTHGRLDLLERPGDVLLAMENPFDPGRNEDARLHDASLFDERYFVYFGPAPVLSAYLPWRTLTGTDLPDRWAAAFFLSGGFLFLLGIYLTGVRSAANPPSPLVVCACACALGFTTGGFFLVARAVVYEVALASAFFWTAAAVFFALRALRSGRMPGWFAAAGACAGMAMASRHSFVLAGVALGLLIGLALLRSGLPWTKRFRGMAAFALPAALSGMLLLAHNQARFGDPAEFGHNLQVGVVDPSAVEFLDPENFAYNAFVQTLHPPGFTSGFPFLSLEDQRICSPVPKPAGHVRTEEAAGFLVTNPYLLLLLVFPFLPGRRKRDRSPESRWLEAVVLLIGIVHFVLIASFFYGCLRYWMDYLPWLVLLFCLAWTRTDGSLPPGVVRGSVRTAACLLIAASLLFHLALAVQQMAVGPTPL
ncbi:MAG: hypothetical protein ACLFRP_06420 [Puniceicoccaceae bacterium]